MRKDEPAMLSLTGARPATGGFVATAAMLVAALVCSIVVIAAPRPVQPSRLPALRVPLAEGMRAFGALELDPEQPLPRASWLSSFLELYREAGLNEREKRVDMALVEAQRLELAQLVREHFPKLGRAGVRALMHALTARALDALGRSQPPPEAFGLLGSFPALLRSYGYVDTSGVAVAPARVIQHLYEQRFNLICGRPLDADIDRSARALAEGWIALHGERLPPERRVQAAHKFLELGGIDAREALAVWLYQGGLKEEAADLLQRQYAHTGALRLRNMLLSIQQHR